MSDLGERTGFLGGSGAISWIELWNNPASGFPGKLLESAKTDYILFEVSIYDPAACFGMLSGYFAVFSGMPLTLQQLEPLSTGQKCAGERL